ncbi:hypothetical protein LY90DRAFT_510836 [Neocallimastix californiae]|uniref:Uncharacterized protein n=1 Tax=Neocallimastix californiae TaxID=1754190 RepID=A0A1Y2BVC3_9FUNG|nr:hypothetical protein LY90DRAFT_510836 [Neocallimastix californiae]|eukprot:ORY38722.1 hypothetical protein LY90DRAFT_510836 [Neocallimastix californiae]
MKKDNAKEILNYDSLHNHLEKEFDASISIEKHKIKDEINKKIIPLGIKPKLTFNKVSEEMGFICSEYKTVKSQITRDINKQLLPDVTKCDEIPDESKYYKTVRNTSFIVFINPNLISFQFPFQENFFIE